MKAYESLGVSAEDYLEAIFVLERQLGAVRSIDVARWLDVSKPSVCHAMKKLIAGGVDPVQAEEDACRLEHALSAESFEKLKQAAR